MYFNQECFARKKELVLGISVLKQATVAAHPLTTSTMKTEVETAGSCPSPGQAPIKTWLPSSRRGASATTKVTVDPTSRFHGDGVRYKAKLIGTDEVVQAQGDKMCLDSMMKLKGQEVASRSHGKHKQRVWLWVCSTGVKIVDEKTRCVMYEHDASRISSLRRDESDPRALAYVFQHQHSYTLFYIKMANMPPHSTAQILSNFFTPPVVASPYSSPTTMGPWGLAGPFASLSPPTTPQWGGGGAAPWPSHPGTPAAWAPASSIPGPVGAPMQAYGPPQQHQQQQPGVPWGQNVGMYPSPRAPAPPQQPFPL
ncbi:unnamed protein product [Merluccius merluccius]